MSLPTKKAPSFLIASHSNLINKTYFVKVHAQFRRKYLYILHAAKRDYTEIPLQERNIR